MDLTHTFTVPASVEETWKAFLDIEDVAGCFPGATVTSVEGDEFKGTCKVRLGPISLVYSGSGRFVDRDESAHSFVIEAKGKDKRGNGTAGATVTAVLAAASPTTTDVEVRTDLAITGKPAQFGRGVMQDVSDKLLGQFVTCLETRVGGAPEPAGSEPAGPGGVDAGTSDAGISAAAASSGGARKAPASTYASTPAPGVHAGPRQDDDALDLGATVIPVLLRSYWKPVAGLVLALLVLRKLLRP